VIEAGNGSWPDATPLDDDVGGFELPPTTAITTNTAATTRTIPMAL